MKRKKPIYIITGYSTALIEANFTIVCKNMKEVKETIETLKLHSEPNSLKQWAYQVYKATKVKSERYKILG